MVRGSFTSKLQGKASRESGVRRGWSLIRVMLCPGGALGRTEVQVAIQS